jgi:hypothetical protein
MGGAVTSLASRVMRPAWLRGLGPLQVGLLAAGIAVVIVAARLTIAADGDISRFVVAGDTYTDRISLHPDIYVFEASSGYDGQFFWRLAVDPAEWDLSQAHGVQLDSAYRLSRIGYPLLAWLLAGGQPELATWSLVGINIAALAMLAGLGAVLAERAGRPAALGLLVASAPGLVFALARDLAEPLTLAALAGGIVALQQDGSPPTATGPPETEVVGTTRARPVVAALAWSCAVLAREQALVVVAGYGLWRMTQLVTRRARPSVHDLPWVLPFLVYVAWQGAVWAAIGQLPSTAATGNNLSLPFTDLVPSVWRWLHGDLPRLERLAPVQLALAGALVVVALHRAAPRVPSPDRWLVVALTLSTAAAVSLARPVWAGPADVRQLSDVFTISWIVLLVASERLPQWLVGASAGVWLATVGLRVVAI